MYIHTVIRWISLFRSKFVNSIACSSPSHVFLYQWICLQKLVLTSWKWVTDLIYHVTMEMMSLNTFLGNFQHKFTAESATCIIFILFHLGRQNNGNIIKKSVISWLLIVKAPYNIDNKLDQFTYKIFNTTFVSTMHMGYNFWSSSFLG